MAEFRISSAVSKQSRDRVIRPVVWGAVAILFGVMLFSMYGTESFSLGVNRALAWVAGLTVAATVVWAYAYSARMGLKNVRLNSVFVLTDRELVRHIADWPDVSIGLS